MPWKLGDKIIREGKGWVGSDGTKYSSLWARMTDAEKKAAGLTYVPDPKIWDNRFYWGWDAEEKNLIERKIDDEDATDQNGKKLKDGNGNQVINYGLKSLAIANTKTTAKTKLSDSDWYVIRSSETGGKAVPTNVSTYRAAVRTACASIEAKITACKKLDDFIELHEVPRKDGVPTGNAPINDWPDELI